MKTQFGILFLRKLAMSRTSAAVNAFANSWMGSTCYDQRWSYVLAPCFGQRPCSSSPPSTMPARLRRAESSSHGGEGGGKNFRKSMLVLVSLWVTCVAAVAFCAVGEDRGRRCFVLTPE